jgi:hypothetical protein
VDVLIIGARGVFGALTADAFRAAGWAVRRAVRTPRAGEVEVDLDRPETIAAALRDDELVVNTVPHPALLAERAVLERGGTLINTSAMPAAAGRSLRAVAGGARGTVLMNAGLAPGVTTVLAAELLRAHPEATELEIVFTLSSAAPRGPASSGFLHRGLTAVPRHRTVLAPLPPPFGERRCVGFGESDAGWLGGVAEGRVIRVYICIAEPTAHERMLALNDAGAMRTLPRTIWGPPRAPGYGPSDEPVAHWVAAKRGDRRLAARTIECRGDYLHAARSTVLFASALRARNPGRGGCFDPEELWTLAELEPLLRAGGVTIASQSVSDLTPAAG